jgi:hypothetical protein
VQQGLLLLLLLLLLALLRHPAHSKLSQQLQVCDDLAAVSSSIHEAGCPDHAWALRELHKQEQTDEGHSVNTSDASATSTSRTLGFIPVLQQMQS